MDNPENRILNGMFICAVLLSLCAIYGIVSHAYDAATYHYEPTGAIHIYTNYTEIEFAEETLTVLNTTPNISVRVSKLLKLNNFTFYNATCLFSSFICATGTYSGNKIRIAALEPDIEQVIVHEIGHQFYSTILTDSERDNWHNIYNVSGASTGYGDTDEQEDFADYFAWIQNTYSNNYHRIRSNNSNKTDLINSALDNAPEFDIRSHAALLQPEDESVETTTIFFGG